MSLSRGQIITLKRAQAEARLSDFEYRDAISSVAGVEDCRSSKDPRLTDGHWDILLAYMEAIFWRGHDASSGPRPVKAVFRTPGYWAEKNKRGNNSRDRFTDGQLREEVQGLEAELMALGFGLPYLSAIQNRIRPFSLVNYRAALRRTLASKKGAHANAG